MHPAEEIFCEKSSKLRGKTVVIGITGSIAATECFSTVRELIRHGAKVISCHVRGGNEDGRPSGHGVSPAEIR